MKKIPFLLSVLFLSLPVWMQAQEKGFVLKGCLPGMRDGVKVALLNSEDLSSETIVETTAKNGCFELRGKVAHPILCTLTTNNLDLLAQYAPHPDSVNTDSIRWTYTSVFLDNAEMKVEAARYSDLFTDWSVTPYFRITGGEVQNDFNEYHLSLYQASDGNPQKDDQTETEKSWDFILSHPHSVISVYFANNMLQRGYGLTKEQVDKLEKAVVSVPADTARFTLFKNLIEYAKQTTVGAPLVNLELTSTDGKTVNLEDIVPKDKFVLIDFWASWCGMCLYAMPDIKKLQEQYHEQFVVIGVSCDRDEKAWRNMMEKKKMPWKQYLLSKQGYEDFFKKYRVGNSVPYYTMIAPDGKVMKAPSGVEEISTILKLYCK